MSASLSFANRALLEPDHNTISGVRSVLNDALLGKAEVVEHVLACLLGAATF